VISEALVKLNLPWRCSLRKIRDPSHTDQRWRWKFREVRVSPVYPFASPLPLNQSVRS